MYSSVFSAIKIHNTRTEFFECSIGVKQGETLSPTLFNIYTHDLPSVLDSENSPCLNERKVTCLMFADDLVLFSLDQKSLQSNMNKLQEFCEKWRLRINVKKTKIIEFCISGRISKCKF